MQRTTTSIAHIIESPHKIIYIAKQFNLHGSTVSHESIYKYIYEDKVYGGRSYQNQRTGNKRYKKRYGKHKIRKIIIKNKISIN